MQPPMMPGMGMGGLLGKGPQQVGLGLAQAGMGVPMLPMGMMAA